MGDRLGQAEESGRAGGGEGNRLRRPIRAGALGWLLLAPCMAVSAPAERPNVLVILGDDMGFSDLGCYGGEARTPNLDALAKNGVRFTQFYNGARCCPSRASLLTGLYPHQTGMGHMTHHDRGLPGYRAELNRQCATLAEVLGDSGYRTYMVGKWHVNRHENPDGPKDNWPLQRGFEKYYGIIWGSSSFFDPAICRDNTWYSRESDPEYKPEKFYLTNAFTDNAVTFLQQHEKESPDKPFFLYAAYTAAHWPMHALEEDIARYKGRFDAGYDALRQDRVKRLRELGLIDPRWEAAPTAENLDNVKNREWELRGMEVYAAMIDSMDQGIGRIVAELKRQGRFDNTLILFMQDNGACAEDLGRKAGKTSPGAKLRPLRPEELPAGGRQPDQTRDGRPVRRGPEVMPGGEDSYIAYGLAWANVSNTPFREYKHWVHEGGIATPLIVSWPKGIPQSRRNGLATDPSHLIDIMATCVDATGTPYPKVRGGEKITPMQGVSLRPALAGERLERQQPLCWEHEGNRAIRKGKWKLVAREDRPWELYDMDADRTERNDLAKRNPDKVSELSAEWDVWAARSNVLPLGGWKLEQPAEAKAGATLILEPGQVLEGDRKPEVHDRALSITVEILHPNGDGVLVAQGGRMHGYSFSVRDSKLCFEIRNKGELLAVVANAPLGGSPVTVEAVLGRRGYLRLLCDGREVAAATLVGQLAKTPEEGMSVGHDSGDPVGKYPSLFAYRGRLGRVVLETEASASR